jgi:glycosyltransferase involved in cell wall biosynthesis
MEYAAKGLHLLTRQFVRENMYGIPRVETFRVLGTNPCTPALYGHIRWSDYDAVHVSAFPYSTSLMALEAARRRGISTVFTPFFHFRLPSFAGSAVLKAMVLRASALVACTGPEKEALARLGADRGRIFVVPLSLDLGGVGPAALDPNATKVSLGVEGRFVILTHPWVDKGVLVLLDAIEAFAASHRNLALVTIGNPDPVYERRRDLLRMRYPDVIIRDLGWVPPEKKWRAFSACDVFVMVSLTDAFGLSYLHAWALEKPIVAARGTSADGLVREGEDGLLGAHDKPGELVDILESLYTDVNPRDRMGRAGRARVLREFTPERFMRGYEQVFDFVTSKDRGSPC